MSTALDVRHFQVTVLGVVLCLLAALFSIEAKVAWYAPSSSPATQISASKLQQADAPRLVAHALSSSDNPVPHFPEIAKVLAFIGVAEDLSPEWRITETHWETLPLADLAPNISFRPPPSL